MGRVVGGGLYEACTCSSFIVPFEYCGSVHHNTSYHGDLDSIIIYSLGY